MHCAQDVKPGDWQFDHDDVGESFLDCFGSAAAANNDFRAAVNQFPGFFDAGAQQSLLDADIGMGLSQGGLSGSQNFFVRREKSDHGEPP